MQRSSHPCSRAGDAAQPSQNHPRILLASLCCSLSWESTLGIESPPPTSSPSVFTALEGDRIQIGLCDHKSVFIYDRNHPEILTEPGAPRRTWVPRLSTGRADPLLKGIPYYFGYFAQEMHIKQTKIEHKLKFKHILKSLLAQGLKQGLRATHHITFN